MNLRKAPPRKVIEIWRTGTYGNAQWHHRLECGHVQVRKRKAPAPEAKCAACLEQPDTPPERSARYDPLVQAASLEQHTTAGLAAHFELDQELITVVVDATDPPQVTYAQIMLPADYLRRKGLL